MKILFLIKGDKNMKNILTSAITATLLAGLALSTMSADNSLLVFDGNKSKHEVNSTVWIESRVGQEFNLTLIPVANYKGASFDMQFTNGGIDTNRDQILCVGDTKVGSLQDPGTTDKNGYSANPRYSFTDDAEIAKLLKKDANITFKTGSDCNSSDTTALKIVSLDNKPCQKVTAKIIKGTSTQGNNIESIVTEAGKEAVFGNTKQAIKISCTVPVCYVENEITFNNKITPPGINQSLTQNIDTSKQQDGGQANCPGDGCSAVTASGSSCTTYLHIANVAPKKDLNITKIEVKSKFVDPNNKKVAKPVSYKITLPNVSNGLGNDDDNTTIKVVFTTDGKNPITLGTLKGELTFKDNNNTKVTNMETDLAQIAEGAKTKFTVPYMYGSASVSNFVKISNINSSSIKLSAVVTDSKGNSCNVTYKDIPANASTFIWAGKVPSTKPEHQALVPAGECSNLEDNKYSVVFTSGGAVNVISYMRTKRGERTVIPF
jgi:hypothetical protein